MLATVVEGKEVVIETIELGIACRRGGERGVDCVPDQNIGASLAKILPNSVLLSGHRKQSIDYDPT